MSSPKKEVLTLEQTIGISSKVASMAKHLPNVISALIIFIIKGFSSSGSYKLGDENDDGHDDHDEEFDDDHDDERDNGREEGVKDDDLDFNKKRDGGAEDELEDRGGESQGGLHPKVGQIA